MESFAKKKLLILGAYQSEVEIIKAARELGLYTIVTDNHTDWEQAPAKFVADEAWNISWSDIKALREKCIEDGVQGVFAGFSEPRIQNAQKLATALDKPFYTDGVNLEVICDKIKFKQACVDSGVTVPRKYSLDDKIEYPVIVKPADNGGSRGISICYSDEELREAYEKAMQQSPKKEVVIEQYIVADEVMVYFTVHNGFVDLSAMCDRYMYRFDKNITQLPVGYYFPSKYLNVFTDHNLEKFERLIQNLGIRDGLIAFQAFVVGTDVIPFDPTYRLDGTMSYHMIEKRNNINVLKMLIAKSITGSMGIDAEISKKENAFFEKPTFELPILLKAGRVSTIEGLDEIRNLQNVVFVYQNKFIGDRLDKVADFSQIMCRIHICAENDDAIKETVDAIYSRLKVLDENGGDMIIGRKLFHVGV